MTIMNSNNGNGNNNNQNQNSSNNIENINREQQILNGFTEEQKRGPELYNGNHGPINGDESIYQQQYNNRSIEEKIYYGGQNAGYSIQPEQEQREIVAVHMEEGNLAAFKLDDGTILSKTEAIELTKRGGIKDCNVGRRGSRETLRRNPVEDASKSLTNLPRF